MYQRQQDFQNAENDLRTRLLALESRWLQIEAQMIYLREIWNRLPSRLQIHFNNVLSWLNTLLTRATDVIDNLIRSSKATVRDDGIASLLAVISKEGKLRRGAFALSQKDALDKLVNELRIWHQDTLGPSWFQLLRLPRAVLVDESDRPTNVSTQVTELKLLHQKVDLADGEDFIHSQDIATSYDQTATIETPIFGSDLVTSLGRSTQEMSIVERIKLPTDIHRAGTIRNFHRLGQKLSAIEPLNMSLLPCAAIVDLSKSSDFDVMLLFKAPSPSSSPRSLREVLLERDERYPLQSRILIAAQLARSVISVHSLKMVHKNIRPECALIFDHATSNSPQTFLLGFEQFRLVDASSLLRGDVDWRRALYRHPSRHGIHPEVQYRMQHDIYSLGVCLLEVGLWTSFVLNLSRGGIPCPELDSSRLADRDPRRRANVIKGRLQDMARTQLPAKMGGRYTDVVLSCLSCLDPGDTQFGDEDDFEDSEEIEVSVRYMEKVSHNFAPSSALPNCFASHGSDTRQILLQLQSISI